ncbi:hypothetical protein ACHWQZ_G011870 [Mnemiopsis leidyi]
MGSGYPAIMFISIILIASVRYSSSNLGSADNIANKIGEVLVQFMGKWFDKDAITKIYNTQSYNTYTGLQILEIIKKNVTRQFLNSEEALGNIRKSALESFYNYSGDTMDFDFLERFRNRTHKNRPISYHQTANFKREVSVTNSSLVLPLDVYYNWTEVRETILWTANMDTAFKENWSPNLTGSATLLQYIGTPHGVMRVYPSYYTPRIGKWVTYDHRFRIWYAVGAMESNKVVFLMDKSGTLVGEPVKLMREMAINIIKTMISDEDYISVLTFNNVVEPLGCGAQLVRARSRIKTILNEQIRKISPEGAGNLTEAIRKGFEVLNNSKNQETCHSTLVLFTDYTQTDVVKIFNKYNKDSSVKIVILQVSKDIMFSRDLRKAAHSLNGIYARIEDLSDISPTILELTSAYTSMVDDDDLQTYEYTTDGKNHVKTTPMYKDASTEEYITTLVLPVVTDKVANWTKSSSLPHNKGSFLGVAAVDIEAKSLGQYPLSSTRGCYAITVDLKVPKRTNVQNKLVRDILPENLGPQKDESRDTAYCSYSSFSFNDFDLEGVSSTETVDQFISRKLQFPECHDFAYEIFDDIYMVSTYLSSFLEKDPRLSVTTAAGNRFEIKQGKRLRRTNNPYTRERYTRLISLVTNSRRNSTEMLSVTNVTNGNSKRHMFELSQIIYHLQSNSFPLMLSIEIPAFEFEKVIEEPFRIIRRELGGNRYLVDENGFIIATDGDNSRGKHLAKLFPKLMEELLSKGIFNFFNHTECYFSCEDTYPEDSGEVRNAAEAAHRYFPFPSVRAVSQLFISTTTFVSRLISNIWFIILNPASLVSGMPDSATQFNEDWKSIKINLTCCHIHPFMSRNFSVMVDQGSNLQQDPTCTKSYKYNAVPNTNLLFVWAYCTDSLCECDEPEYNLDTIVDKILDPCSESDENYNPASHCTSEVDGIRQKTRNGAPRGTGNSYFFIMGHFLCIFIGVVFYSP